MKNRILTPGFVCAIAILGSSVSIAGTISLTGAELVSAPGVTFPIFTPTILGSSIVITSDGSDFPKLAEIPLFSAGQLQTALPTTVLVDIGFTRGSADFDPIFMIGDGSKMAGGGVFDNLGGGVQFLTFDDVGVRGTLLQSALNFASGVGYPAIGQSETISYEFGFAGGVLSAKSTFRGVETNIDFASNFLDFTTAIDLIFVSDNEIETYQIDSVSITRAIPAPGSFGLLMFGLVILGATRISRA